MRVQCLLSATRCFFDKFTTGRVLFGDMHLSNFEGNIATGVYNVHDQTEHKVPPMLSHHPFPHFHVHGFFRQIDKEDSRKRVHGHLDIAVIEATEITSDGGNHLCILSLKPS
jgi:hypothetical protein